MQIMPLPVPCLMENRAGLFCAAPLGHTSLPNDLNGAGRDKPRLLPFAADAHIFKTPAEVFGAYDDEGRQVFEQITQNVSYWAVRLDKIWDSSRMKPAFFPALSVYANTLMAIFQSCKTPEDVHKRCYDFAPFLYFTVETIEACRQAAPPNTQGFLSFANAYRERARVALKASDEPPESRWRCSQ